MVIKQDERDEFYVFRLKDLQVFFSQPYAGGRRPKNPQSFHCAVWREHLQELTFGAQSLCNGMK